MYNMQWVLNPETLYCVDFVSDPHPLRVTCLGLSTGKPETISPPITPAITLSYTESTGFTTEEPYETSGENFGSHVYLCIILSSIPYSFR